MKVIDKEVKLYIINKLENYNHNTKVGEIEHDKMEHSKDQTRLFIYLSVVGLIISILKNHDLLIIFLSILIVAELLYIHFVQDKYIEIHNAILREYQVRNVSNNYIDRLLRELNEEWVVNWEGLYPVVTESMFEEDRSQLNKTIRYYGKGIRNNLSIEYISRNMEQYYEKNITLSFKCYVRRSGFTHIKKIKSKKVFGLLRKNIFLFARINSAFDNSGFVNIYDYYPIESYKYPKFGPPSWQDGYYSIKVKVYKGSNSYFLFVIKKRKLNKNIM